MGKMVIVVIKPRTHRMYRSNYEYKDSKIEWLGKVPAHWNVMVLGRVNHVQSGYAFDSTIFCDVGVPIVQMSNLKRGKVDLAEAKNYPLELCPLDVGLKEGDVLIGMSGSIGETGSLGNFGVIQQCDLPCFLNQRVGKFVTTSRIITGFISYLIQSSLFFDQVQLSVTGTAQFNISSSQLSKIWLGLPPIEEQQTIAAYLDRETGRIDALIQKKERMIELQKEKRIALITQAVTKGFNSNAPLKDSGIDWLGFVPEHWDVKRLKYVSSCNDETLPETTDPDYELLYVDISSVTRIEGITNKEEMSFEDAPSRARRRVRDGDTIVSTVRTYLRAIAPIENAEDNLIVSTGFAVLRPLSIYSGYLSLLIQSHFVVESIVARSVGVSYPAINASDIGEICITIPPMSEQQSIVDTVRKATLQIDELQSQNELSITLLREYRSSLINHAVTGKIDLRDYDAQAQ